VKILITGGTGFIGAHLAKHCADSGHITHICDNNSRGQNDEFIKRLINVDGVKFYKIDLTKPQEVRQLPVDYDIVFHLAAINGTENFYKIPYSVMDVSIKSTMLLLEHFGNTEVNFVYSSSSEVYAGTLKSNPNLIPTNESVPCTIEDVNNERFSYGGSKLACEILITNYAKQFGLNYQIIRYHNIYGPRMGTKHVMPQFIRRAKDRETPFNIYGADQTRAFCYIDDAVVATLQLGLLKGLNGIVHVGNDLEEIQMIEIAKIVKDWYNLNVENKIFDSPIGSVMRRCPDITKLRDLTGYIPKISLSKGLEKTIEWYDSWYENSSSKSKGIL